MILEVNHLSVNYKELKAVDDISFNINEGEIFTIIGPNGAGKTSTIESIVGLNKKYEGDIIILGTKANNIPKSLYNEIGVQLQEASFPDKLKVDEVCKMFSKLYDNPVDYNILLKEFDLESKKNSYIRDLSGGQKQRLSIIIALLPDPKIIFLDELTTGLDPKSRRMIWNIILKEKKKNKTIVLSTHFMDEAEFLSDRIAILVEGKLQVVGTLEEIFEKYEMGEGKAPKLEDVFLKLVGYKMEDI
ncbi:ABC transporter ATP-binding protein [Clostridium sp. MSJ-4]|uniref:ABC transporter ATP-binding protein n=1 Tax=Clostridium simiarum TaxID=2841506 RepID=A0ABS6EZS2_9CLOT|nr:ABC transporter ATP-binding protein [Clostridium simiarum]MBU5591625.1 ABC transporter ATP-binding protein [Clostridium simiarum]